MDVDIPTPFSTKTLNVLRKCLVGTFTLFASLFAVCRRKRIPVISEDILKFPAIEVARKIRYREITSAEVVRACIKRIEEVNRTLNCLVCDRFELALQEASDIDAFIRSGTKSTDQLHADKPLLGVPFTTKDSICVKGLPATCGIYSKRNNIATEDAEVIRLLREKGAVIIGLTNVPELCMWWETYNTIYGRTNNPYDTARMVGGSSGGEGALQAAGGSMFGIGSDIGGSIRMPGYFNGVFGHKATRKTVSNEGNFPPVTQEAEDACLAMGPLTRFAVDLKPILKILCKNPNDLKLDTPVDIGKLNVYYQVNINAPLTDAVDFEIEAALMKVVDYFKLKYNTNAEKRDIKLLKQSTNIWFASIATDTSPVSQILENPTKCKAFGELMKNIFGCSKNTLVPLLLGLSKEIDLNGVEYRTFKELGERLESLFKNLLGDDGIFLFPTHPTAALYHNESLPRAFNFTYTSVINSLGFPSTTVPLGLNRKGLPIGIQVVANHYNDRLCLAVAEDLEKAFGGWIEPQRKMP
ncbi:unnamed protein product [Pieris brassicae]|uniref:Amidase domain-containing protein n=1 Tax=Pieris brassicae TaxID=7116 RepID=A0A9P0XBH3_PIEBR|nr:unnamed protein product [Pieris brassicae]